MLTAFGLTFLLGFLALAIDTGRLLYARRQMQTLADAAALSAATEIGTCNGSVCAAMQNAATSALTENNVTGISFVSQCETGSATGGITLTLNDGPCYLGSADPNYNNSDYVEALVTEKVSTIFAALVGQKAFTVQARSEAGGTKPKYCAYILSQTASPALLFNGNASYQSSCGIIVDSTANPAATFNGSVDVSTTAIDVVGGDLINGHSTVSPTPVTGATGVSDPLSTLPAPAVGSCGASTASPYSGSPGQVTVNGNSSAVFNPGVYCGGIQVNGNTTVTFNAGTYIVKGSMILNGGDTASGSGVTLYFTSNGSLTMNGNSHVTLSAPTTGTYAGILYFQDRTDPSTVIINGDTTSSWQGAIYAPDAQLTVNGNGNVAAYTFLVVNTMVENGNDSFSLGNDYSSLPNGSPIKKKLLIHVAE